MSIYRDLQINNGDVVLDAGNNPSYLSDRAAIAQDIAHAILDNGLAHLLIGDRGTGVTADTRVKLKLLVEDDTRIVPGTVRIEQLQNGQWWVYADTINFGPLAQQLTGAQ